MTFWSRARVEGLVAYYGLTDWWLTTFSKNEREYIDNEYQPFGFKKHLLTQGKVISISMPASQLLRSLETLFTSKNDASILKKIHDKVIEVEYSQPIIKPGYYKGRHYTTYVDEVKNLKRDEKYEEAEKLLLELVNATEEENNNEKMGVAPWYYEQLAIIYRKQKNYQNEVSILERYKKQKPPKHWGVSEPPPEEPLIKRLEKAKILTGKV